jgi:hypothetical protein
MHLQTNLFSSGVIQREWQGILLLLVLVATPLLWTAQVFAGAATTLTEAQYAQLKTYITVTAKPEFDEHIAAGNDQPIADALNVAFSPAFQVLKTSVSRKTIVEDISPQGTTFKATTNGYFTRTIQELDLFNRMFDRNDVMDPSMPNNTTLLTAIFSGTGDAQLNRVHIGNQSRRAVTRAEKLYVTQGQGTGADPGYLVWEGMLTQYDISYALRGVR